MRLNFLMNLMVCETQPAQPASAAPAKSAQAFDAEIILKVDGKGESVVDKVVFIQRKK